ncbi:hypothetical protein [Rhodoblastus sp.]|uniref:hypothetical protein n=1 Tax=Rhodoblastus sp. TaxID=1962975 RepID=UPI00260ACC77|nr:hypothetical protein [Rhodoblastus sp.]
MARKFKISCVPDSRTSLAILLFLAGSVAAWAAGDHCEKIKDADAYNACLATSGPAFHEGRFTGAPRTDTAPKIPRERRRRAEAPKRNAKRPAHGRVRIEIYPGK